MLNHRNDVHQVCMYSVFVGYQFHKTNQLLAQECPDEETAVEKCRLLRADGLDILAIMGIRLTLTHRAFVVDLPDSLNERVVERHLTNGYAFFRRLSGPIPRGREDLAVPPLVKSRYGQDCQIVPLHIVGIFR